MRILGTAKSEFWADPADGSQAKDVQVPEGYFLVRVPIEGAIRYWCAPAPANVSDLNQRELAFMGLVAEEMEGSGAYEAWSPERRRRFAAWLSSYVSGDA